jgi:hypothetical protein
MIMTALDKWYDYVKSHDRAALWDLLHLRKPRRAYATARARHHVQVSVERG